MSDNKTKYGMVVSTSSHCPDCCAYVTLVADMKSVRNKPAFYICWQCKKVFEVGKGEVILE